MVTLPPLRATCRGGANLCVLPFFSSKSWKHAPYFTNQSNLSMLKLIKLINSSYLLQYIAHFCHVWVSMEKHNIPYPQALIFFAWFSAAKVTTIISHPLFGWFEHLNKSILFSDGPAQPILNLLSLKGRYTFGNCQTPVFQSLGLSQHKHKACENLSPIWSSELRENDERKNTLVWRIVCFQIGIKDFWLEDF